MVKRLNSETNFKKDGFKIKVGTTNRLNPQTVYIDLGGYVIPQENKIEYEEDINELNKTFNKHLKNKLCNISVFDKKYICVIETAHERMKKGKTSYISLQCHLKQTGNLNAEEIIKQTTNLTNNLTSDLTEIMKVNGFLVKN